MNTEEKLREIIYRN